MLKSSLCGYSDPYILGTITVANTAATATAVNNVNKNIIFVISEMNNAEIDNGKDIDVVMPMYNLIEYSDNDSKTRT